MFGLSFEHIIIVGIILLIFGPRRLPELGHTLGKGIRNFKDAMAGVEEARYRKIDETQSKVQSAKTDAPAASDLDKKS